MWMQAAHLSESTFYAIVGSGRPRRGGGCGRGVSVWERGPPVSSRQIYAEVLKRLRYGGAWGFFSSPSLPDAAQQRASAVPCVRQPVSEPTYEAIVSTWAAWVEAFVCLVNGTRVRLKFLCLCVCAGVLDSLVRRVAGKWGIIMCLRVVTRERC